MYNKISQKITVKLLSNGVIKREDFEIYEYGFELLISLISTISIIFIISFFVGNPLQTLLFLIGFFAVRIICGGFHAKHHWSCFAITISTYFIFLLLYALIHHENKIRLTIFVITILSTVIIILFAPINNPQNNLSEYRKHKNKHRSILLAVSIWLIYILSCFINIVFIESIAPFFIGFFIAAMAVLVAKLEILILKRKEDAS